MNELPIDFLYSRFWYDQENGNLIWKKRPVSEFPSVRIAHTWNSKWAGQVAGTRDQVKLTINGRSKFYKMHRVIWAMTYGEWPKDEIDHRKGSSNKLENLREATHTENMQNPAKRSHNTSGFTGVYHRKDTGRYNAEIRAFGKKYCLGSFDTPEIAYDAYLAAKAKHHPFQPAPKE